MDSVLIEFKLIRIDDPLLQRLYCDLDKLTEIDEKEEELFDYLKLEHLPYNSLKLIKIVDEKLQYRPFFLKSKYIRDEIGKEIYIKSEYSEKWHTYKNTNRVSLSTFLKHMLPYVDKPVIKRLKYGKSFRKEVDGLMRNDELLKLTRSPHSYAVINPNKTKKFYTEKIIRDLRKKFSVEELIYRIKDEEWVRTALERYRIPNTE